MNDKLTLQKHLYWMLELKANWDNQNEQESADYKQLLEDIQNLEEFIQKDLVSSFE